MVRRLHSQLNHTLNRAMNGAGHPHRADLFRLSVSLSCFSIYRSSWLGRTSQRRNQRSKQGSESRRAERPAAEGEGKGTLDSFSPFTFVAGRRKEGTRSTCLQVLADR